MKYFVECDSCNNLGQVPPGLQESNYPMIPRGWYQFTGPHPKLHGTPPKDICGNCADEIIRERMSASEPENSG